MPFDLTARPPRTVDGYLELLAQAIFASGLSWGSIAGRWQDIRAAFDGFSVRKVSAYGSDDVSRVLESPGMIRNRAKIEAVITTAEELASVRDAQGSVQRWLEAMPGFDERAAALREFPYVGRFGAYYVLSVAGYEVPAYEKWRMLV